MLAIRQVASQGPVSCLGLVQWRVPRSEALQRAPAIGTGVSIALECGGKDLMCGSRALVMRSDVAFGPSRRFVALLTMAAIGAQGHWARRTSSATATADFLAPDILGNWGRAVPAGPQALGRTLPTMTGAPTRSQTDHRPL